MPTVIRLVNDVTNGQTGIRRQYIGPYIGLMCKNTSTFTTHVSRLRSGYDLTPCTRHDARSVRRKKLTCSFFIMRIVIRMRIARILPNGAEYCSCQCLDDDRHGTQLRRDSENVSGRQTRIHGVLYYSWRLFCYLQAFNWSMVSSTPQLYVKSVYVDSSTG